LDELGLVPGRYVIEVARVTQHKRQHELIEAFRDAGAKDWKLAIVGDVKDAGAYGARVARDAHGSSRVVLTGYRQGTELSQLFQYAGLFVLPSSYEGMPLAVLEAMSHGLPVVLSDIDAHLRFGLDPEHYFPLGDVRALTERLLSFMTHCNIAVVRQTMLSESQGYSWCKIAEQTRSVLLRSLSTRRSPF
jgi:glycosyltransferase involved in cell wall biosynthesis